jgi:hypothetical protein
MHVRLKEGLGPSLPKRTGLPDNFLVACCWGGQDATGAIDLLTNRDPDVAVTATVERYETVMGQKLDCFWHELAVV